MDGDYNLTIDLSSREKVENIIEIDKVKNELSEIKGVKEVSLTERISEDSVKEKEIGLKTNRGEFFVSNERFFFRSEFEEKDLEDVGKMIDEVTDVVLEPAEKAEFKGISRVRHLDEEMDGEKVLSLLTQKKDWMDEVHSVEFVLKRDETNVVCEVLNFEGSLGIESKILTRTFSKDDGAENVEFSEIISNLVCAVDEAKDEIKEDMEGE